MALTGRINALAVRYFNTVLLFSVQTLYEGQGMYKIDQVYSHIGHGNIFFLHKNRSATDRVSLNRNDSKFHLI